MSAPAGAFYPRRRTARTEGEAAVQGLTRQIAQCETRISRLLRAIDELHAQIDARPDLGALCDELLTAAAEWSLRRGRHSEAEVAQSKVLAAIYAIADARAARATERAA